MAPLFGAVPEFIPRGVDANDEVLAFGADLATIRRHQFVQGSPSGIAVPALRLSPNLRLGWRGASRVQRIARVDDERYRLDPFGDNVCRPGPW